MERGGNDAALRRMLVNLLLCILSAAIAVRFRDDLLIAPVFACLAAWQAYAALVFSPTKPTSPVVLRMAGLSWREEDFCRGWLITGQTGSGKTLAAINAMLWQLSTNSPTWGGVCVDDKGV